MAKPLKRLSQICDGTDIHELSACIYPGGHCPLFGVHLALDHMAGVTLLVIGTADCGFYAYKTMKNFKAPQRPGAKIFCGVLEESDVIYGCENQLKPIIEQLDEDPETRMIVVVTSCVIELIGDDIEGIVHGMKTQTPVSVIRTENFKTADYLQGVEQALASVTHLLTPSATIPKSFSVLGPRFRGITENTLVQNLINDGFEMLAEFPCNTDWEAVREISASSFILVADKTALGLAQRLEEKFNIPFVDLCPTISIKEIQKAYGALARITGISCEQELDQSRKKLKMIQAPLRQVFEGKRFVIGNIMGSPFASAALTAELGGDIQLILAGNVYEKDKYAIQKILDSGQDPWVAKNANTSALKARLKEFHPDVYLGMGWSRPHHDPNIQFIPMGAMTPFIGMDYLENFYRHLTTAADKERAS